MRILIMSDLHCKFWDFLPRLMPEVDLCIVAGDITNYGVRYPTRPEVSTARQWLAELALHYHVLWIPGNHDIGVKAHSFEAVPNCECIDGRVVEYNGLRVAGVSLTTAYGCPALADAWDYMTVDKVQERRVLCTDLLAHGPLDILVSHGPPRGFLDCCGYVLGSGFEHIGSTALLDYIVQCEPRMVVCGHVHEARGEEMVGETRIINTARRWQVVEMEPR